MGEPYASPRAKQAVTPIFSVVRFFRDQMLGMGSDMMTRSLTMLVAMSDWIMGTKAPHVPSPVHCAETGRQRKTQAQAYEIIHNPTKTSMALAALVRYDVTKTRRKKHSMLALISESETT